MKKKFCDHQGKYTKFRNRDVLTHKAIFPDDQELSKSLLTVKRKVKGKLLKKYDARTNSALVRKVFSRFLELVIDAVSEGIVITESDCYAFRLDELSTEDMTRLLSSGLLDNYDLDAAGGKIPCFVYDISTKYPSVKPVRISPPSKYTDKSLDLAQKGEIQWIKLDTQW